MLRPNITYRGWSLPEQRPTGEASCQIIRGFYRSFPDYTHTVEEIIAEGDRVAARVVLGGTHLGEFQGIAPTHAGIGWEVETVGSNTAIHGAGVTLPRPSTPRPCTLRFSWGRTGVRGEYPPSRCM